jgi:hypothetical protein
VGQEVERTKRRSGWSVKQTLAILGVARRSCYLWLKEEAMAKQRSDEPAPPVPPYEALSEAKQAVLAYSNERLRGVDWQFKIDHARIKLRSIYPNLEV